MTTHVTTCAKSPLGRLLALTAISLMLLYGGLYLATDGGINLKILTYLKSISSPTMQDRQRELLQAFADHFKKFERVELLAIYGIAILVGFMASGLLGGLIRSYRFCFLPVKGIVERRALWLCVPVWVAGWIVMGLIILLVAGTRRTMTVWLPLWLWLALGVPALILGLVWAWNSQWLEGRWVRLPRVDLRVPLWVIVAIVGVVVMMVAGLVCRWFWMVPLTMPVWVVGSLLFPPLAIIPAWILVPAIAGRWLFIPALKRRVPFARIKRIEVQTQADGGTSLVLTFKDEWSWTIREGSPTRLERVGSVLGRLVGLKRHDLVTWG